MAEITSSDFKKLIEAQQATTRQLMSVEERAADDAQKAEQSRIRSEAAKKGHETRLANQQNQAIDIADGAEQEQEESTSFLGSIAKSLGVQGMFAAADAEAQSKEEGREAKDSSFLKRMAGGITDIAKSAGEKVKAGLSGFSKFAFGALAVAALAFLNSPNFEKIKNTIMDLIIPLLADLYDYILKPLADYLGEKILGLLKDLKAYVDGEKGLGAVLMDNIGMVSAIVLALGVKVLGFSGMLTAVKGIGTALLWVGKGGPITLITSTVTKIGAAFTALKATMVTTVWPAVTAGLAGMKAFFVTTLVPFFAAAAVPIAIIVGVTAAILLAAYSLKQAFDDFMFELEATGSVWEATKTAFVSFFANFMGFIPNLIKDAVSWIVGKFGDLFGIDTTAVTKALDKFDFVDFIKDIFNTIGDTLAGIWDGLLNAIQDILRSPKLKFLGGGFAADALFGTEEEQAEKKKRKEEEQRQFEENRKALREKKILEEEIRQRNELLQKEKAEAEKKAKEAAMVVTKTAPVATKLDTRDYDPRRGMGAPIVNAPISNRSTNTSNHVSTSSTSLINQDRVFDKLSLVR